MPENTPRPSDLPTLEAIRAVLAGAGHLGPSEIEVLDRMVACVSRARSEAPLPVRSPLVYRQDHDERVVYLQPDGTLTLTRDGAEPWRPMDQVPRGALTPARTHVGLADLQAAVAAYQHARMSRHATTPEAMRAALRAARIDIDGDDLPDGEPQEEQP